MVEPARGQRSSRRWLADRPPRGASPAPITPVPAGREAGLFAAIASYADDPAGLAVPGDLTRFEQRAFSQNGEDGVVAEVLRRVGVGPRAFVEFGAGSGHEGVCVALADVLGWAGVFIELDDARFARLEAKYSAIPRVQTVQAAVDAENVDALFTAAAVPTDVDVVAIDVDGNDWWIWRALTAARPRLVVIEYNGNLDPTSQLVKPYDATGTWDRSCWFGASLGAYERLAAEKGYVLVHTDLYGVNAFFLRDDLVAAFGPVAPPRRVANYDLRGARMPGDPTERTWVDLTTHPPT